MCFDKNIHQKFIRFVYNASRICKFGDFEISTQGSGEGRKRKKNRNSVRMKQCREQTLRIYLWLIYTYAADSHSSNILKININFTGKVFCAQACCVIQLEKAKMFASNGTDNKESLKKTKRVKSLLNQRAHHKHLKMHLNISK